MTNNNKPVIKRVIQRCGCDVFVPLALVYMLYIILHGHLSPGGGFQGGVMMVAVVVFLYMGHGIDETEKAISHKLLHVTEGFASIIYIVLAMLGVFAGVRFCENIGYNLGAIGELFSSGTIAWMNWTVGLKVLTGVGVLALSMLCLLKSIDIDHKE